MKKCVRVVVIFILICTVFASFLPSSSSAGYVFFTAVNNSLLPLGESTMPTYFGGTLHVPYSAFYSSGVNYVSSGNGEIVDLYKGLKRMEFDAAKNTTADQDGAQYSGISAKQYNGTLYIPVGFVCNFFNISFSLISADPAPILRIKSSTDIFNDKTFVGRFKTQMQTMYDDYTSAAPISPTPPSPPPTAPLTPTPSQPLPTYRGVTLYLSFYGISPDYTPAILDALAAANCKGCFFVTASEIAGNADLIRRIAGTGNSVGIWLDTGSYDEYTSANALLFEAAKLTAVLTASPPAAEAAAKDTATAHSLVYMDFSNRFDSDSSAAAGSITGSLSQTAGASQSLLFLCGQAAALPGVLQYITQYQYTVTLATETNHDEG